MLRIILWIWRRISDWYTTLDILEWIGWKTGVLAMLASAVAGFAASISGAPWYYSFGLAVSVVLIVLGCIIAWQNYQISHGKSDAKLSHAKRLDIEGFKSMRDAAIELYDAFPVQFIMERARRELELDPRSISIDSKAERLKLAAKYIATKIPIHGKDPSIVRRRIGTMNNMAFNDDLTCLEHSFYPNSSDGKYTEVEVKSDEFAAFLHEEAMHQGAQQESSEMDGK